ncbi:MAG: hypothetical protein JWM53_6378, partial [bacterium]|nr:hypothetical protein [bacterium]
RTDLMAWLAETGLSHDKRRIAEYLRAIFNLKKQRDADEFSGDGSEDDELVLEKALPKPETELQVDAEDPPDEIHLVAPPAAGEVRAIHEASTAPIDTDPEAARKHRISLAEVRRLDPEPAKGGPRNEDTEPLPLAEPPTVRMHADDTAKRILAPPPKKSLWKRLLRLFRRR